MDGSISAWPTQTRATIPYEDIQNMEVTLEHYVMEPVYWSQTHLHLLTFPFTCLEFPLYLAFVHSLLV